MQVFLAAPGTRINFTTKDSKAEGWFSVIAFRAEWHDEVVGYEHVELVPMVPSDMEDGRVIDFDMSGFSSAYIETADQREAS